MNRDLIVIGASAGGIEPLVQLVSDLPPDLPAAVCVVVHIPPTASSRLHLILGRRTSMTVSVAEDGEVLRRRCVYIAPPDQHVLLDGATIRLSRGPRENYSRPSIDVLFRSAAVAAGPRAIGVLLSGTLSDGVAGMRAIGAVGGLTVVQDPDDALFREMPERAASSVDLDHVVPAAELGSLLGRLARDRLSEPARARPQPLRTEPGDRTRRELEVEITMVGQDESMPPPERVGVPSVFGCPECGGVLWEMEDGELVRFRCRVGHAYSAESLLDGELRSIEDALWIAIRALEEHAELHERLASRSGDRGLSRLRQDYARRATEARQQAQLIRRAIFRGDPARDSGVRLEGSALSSIAHAGGGQPTS
jgi:two-component system chemotaxis response regulator CheB